MRPAASSASGEAVPPRALLLLAGRLLLVLGCCAGLALALCALLVQRVRAHDAAVGLATSKLDALSWRSFSSLAELQRSHETFAHVFAVQFPLALLCFSCVYVLKQTFAIPGSALLNVFAGAVLPLPLAFPLVAVLTACGASCCFLLSRLLASEQIVADLCQRALPGRLPALRRQIADASASGQLLYLLLFLRVFPFSPNWFLNLASPWLRVPLPLFAPAVLLGLLPYNLITVQAGATLSTLRSTSDLLDSRTVGSLVLLAGGMLVPAVIKRRKKQSEKGTREKSASESEDDGAEDDADDTDTSSSGYALGSKDD